MRLRLLFASLFLLPAFALFGQRTYTYESVPDDPMAVRIYTLDNGLKVYLSHNPDAPRVQTNIAVRAGSKFDPATATGLAHYLEHMLFKGTSRIGTLDWAKEQEVLKRISDLYEKQRGTTDEAARATIYRQIDSLSNVAARYTVPNEYDKMISSIGARGTNAYTSTERTVYINDIPSNELEKWMAVEAERMRELVLRLFHTEMETVYEEFNRAQDNDYRTASTAKNELLYPTHPYGTQSTIGTGEHLKNPSMEKIHAYFDTYYVANNMAVIMAGDLDYDATIALVDKYFGTWRTGEVPEFTFEPLAPIDVPKEREVFGPMGEWVNLAWRFGGTHSGDPIMLELISGILSNGRAGLIDLNLEQKQRVMDPSAYAYDQMDFAEFGMSGKPKQGQTLEEVRDLLLEQLELVKRGEFDDWLIEAVVNDKRQQRIRWWNENNRARASVLTNIFILEKDWKDELEYLDRMAKITKQQVMDFARSGFDNSHVVVYKRTGENKDAHKVTKPTITAIDINRSEQSDWYRDWAALPSTRLEPVFVDYDESIARHKLKNGVELAHIENTSNELFSIYQIMELGDYYDPRLRLAVEYLPYLGTSRYTAEELQKEFFKLGLRFGVSVSQDRVYISLSGLDAHMAEGVELLEHLMADAQPAPEALAELVKDIAKQREDDLKNKGAIMGAMFNLARYGERSPFRENLSMEQLQRLKPEELITFIRELNDHEHRLFHYGRSKPAEVVALLDRLHRTPTQLKKYPKMPPYEELDTDSSRVYVVDYDMVQNEVIFVSKSGTFNKDLVAYGRLFSEYFGSGLSSIVFQEIREAKGLAYSAYAAYTSPSKAKEAHYVRGYVGTQNDKLGDAIQAMLALMNDMPEDERMFNGARDAAMKQIESGRTTKESIYWSWESSRRLGLEHDLSRDIYAALPAMDLPAMRAFFQEQVRGREFTFMVIGKVEDMDREALEKLGPVEQLEVEFLFGYYRDGDPR